MFVHTRLEEIGMYHLYDVGLVLLEFGVTLLNYADIKKLENTVLNPPAGEIDNFTDDFEDQRNTVSSNLDLID